MFFTKRTDLQVQQSVDNKDYTGGYKFLPWLVYMRTKFLIGAGSIDLLILIASFISMEPIAIGIICGLNVIYSFLLKNEYNKLKKGIST